MDKDKETSFKNELIMLYQASEDRLETAFSYIHSKERELHRSLSDMEARVVLANSGVFPEMVEELDLRTRKVGSDWSYSGEKLGKQRKHEAGETLLHMSVVGRKQGKDGD